VLHSGIRLVRCWVAFLTPSWFVALELGFRWKAVAVTPTRPRYGRCARLKQGEQRLDLPRAVRGVLADNDDPCWSTGSGHYDALP
jgi:hypothetical protein